MNVWRALLAGLRAFFGPTAEEQEADALCSAIWWERERHEQRRAALIAAVKVTEGRR